MSEEHCREATATTSAAFFPHLEHRIRGASSFSVTFPANQSGERLGLYLSAGAALAHHSHQQVSKAIFEPLDVRQHAHGRMVLAPGYSRLFSPRYLRGLYAALRA